MNSDVGTSERVDVCVVGGGLAGLATAIVAAEGGRDVVLVERCTYPRPKVCGGCLNGASVDVLRRLGVLPAVRDAGATTLRRTVVRSAKRRVDLAAGGGLGVTRSTLDTILAERARSVGVRVHTGATAGVVAANVGDRFREVVFGDHRVQAALVVAADGLGRSSHARASSIRHHTFGDSRVGIGVTFAGTTPDGPDAVTMCTGEGGYVGVAAAERGTVSVAAAVDPDFLRSAGSPRAALVQLLSGVGLQWDETLPDSGWLATPRLTRRSPVPAAFRLVEVGDAAGYVEPFTGEGMAWALTCGEALGREIGDGDFDPTRVVRRWPGRVRRIVSRRKAVCRAVAWTLRRPMAVDLALAVLSGVPWLANAVMLGSANADAPGHRDPLGQAGGTGDAGATLLFGSPEARPPNDRRTPDQTRTAEISPSGRHVERPRSPLEPATNAPPQ